MSYLNKVLDGLPAELQCAIRERLIDLQQESARINNRGNEKMIMHLRDIRIAGGPDAYLAMINPEPPTNARGYHRLMYVTDYNYRQRFLTYLPRGEMPNYKEYDRFVGRMKLVEGAVITYTYAFRDLSYALNYIQFEYMDYNIRRNQTPDL
jgi:hypothetical protein